MQNYTMTICNNQKKTKYVVTVIEQRVLQFRFYLQIDEVNRIDFPLSNDFRHGQVLHSLLPSNT